MLPSPTGPYPVGLFTLRHEVQPKQTVGSARFKDGTPALKMNALVYTVFYPCDVSGAQKRVGVPWLVRPLHAAVAGYSKYTGENGVLPSTVLTPTSRGGSLVIVYVYRPTGDATNILNAKAGPVVLLFAAFLKIPAYPDAPLLSPDVVGQCSGWPLVIFSHGLAGTRTTYSQLCCALASQGQVVIAIEHRDGTGPYADGLPPQLCTLPGEIKWTDETLSKFALRVEQLHFRREEIYAIYAQFCNFVAGRECHLRAIGGSPPSQENWRHRVRSEERIVLAGHSFGGATMLSLLATSPPDGHATMQVSHVLCMDPWLEPLSNPGPLPNWNIQSPIFIISSQGFTLWEDHKQVVQKLVDGWPARASFVTIVRSKHESFSDFLLLLPFMRQSERKIMRTILQLSIAFLSDNLEAEVQKFPTVPLTVERKVDKKGKTIKSLGGHLGDVIIH